MPLTIRTTGFEEYLDPSGGAWVKALIIGSHGAGKTPFAANWPKPIIADCEHGLMSVAANAVPYAEIKSSADMDELIRLLKMDAGLPTERRKYKTLVIDTVDSYQRRIIQERLAAEGKEALSGWSDWGWLDGKMQKLIDAATNLPMNLLVNMHYKDKNVGEGDDRTTVKSARLKGDISEAIFQDFDLIGFMEAYYEAEGGERVTKRRIRWHPEPQFAMVRDRSNTLPRFTPVEFGPQDFQIILDSLASGAEGLPESTTLGEYQTAEDGVVDTPDEGAGPVAEPALPPAPRAAAAEKVPPIKESLAKIGDDPVKAQAMMDWEKSRGDAARPTMIKECQRIIDKAADAGTTEPVPEAPAETPVAVDTAVDTPADNPEPDTASEQVSEPVVEDTPEDAPVAEELPAEDAAAVAAVQEGLGATQINGKGSVDEPLTMTEDQVNRLSSGALASLDHVHSPEGKCLRNTYPECGVAGPPAGDAPAEPAPAPVTKPAPAAGSAMRCGDQPPSLAGKFDAVEGCGTVLTPENKDKATLAMVKFKTYLCNDCFGTHAAA